MNSTPNATWLRLAATALSIAVLAACGVTRAPIDERSDPAALPNLRRASQALQERIVREKQHVRDLNEQLSELLASEAAVYAEVFEAEAAYQQLRSDADAVQGDVQAVQEELDQLRLTLETRRTELQAARAESAALEAELRLARQVGLDARRESGFWRGGVGADGEVSSAWVQRMEAFRQQHGIPAGTWAQLLAELGLTRLMADPGSLGSQAPADELPPDSLPPPETAPASGGGPSPGEDADAAAGSDEP